MTPQAIIAVRAPEYAAAPNLDALVSLAEGFVGSVFGGKRDYAIAMLVCHWLMLQSRAADGATGSGPITSEKEGDLAKSYAGPPSGWDAFLALTPYGIEFEEVRRMVVFGARTSGVGPALGFPYPVYPAA